VSEGSSEAVNLSTCQQGKGASLLHNSHMITPGVLFYPVLFYLIFTVLIRWFVFLFPPSKMRRGSDLCVITDDLLFTVCPHLITISPWLQYDQVQKGVICCWPTREWLSLGSSIAHQLYICLNKQGS
jgi:hypothetical protein